MSLEDTLQKLTAAIEANTAAITAATSNGSPAAETPAKRTRKAAEPTPETPPVEQKPAEPAGPTAADVRAAAQAILDANGNDPAPIVAFNKEFGVKRISEIAPERYVEAIAKLKKLQASAAAV